MIKINFRYLKYIVYATSYVNSNNILELVYSKFLEYMSKFLKLAILVVELHLPTLQQMLVQQKMDIGNPVYTHYHRFDQTALPEIFTHIFL